MKGVLKVRPAIPDQPHHAAELKVMAPARPCEVVAYGVDRSLANEGAVRACLRIDGTESDERQGGNAGALRSHTCDSIAEAIDLCRGENAGQAARETLGIDDIVVVRRLTRKLRRGGVA